MDFAVHQDMFDQLMNLVDEDESFYYVDQILNSITYRIFLYRLASYSQWQKCDYAMEARGITFELDDTGNFVSLVSWPFEKFFNLHENPFTMNLDLSDPVEIQLKEDGSLISTVNTVNGLWLKSKGSLFSDQATAARQLLDTDEYADLRHWLNRMVRLNYTVSMEYTAPDNRIVVPYNDPALTVLAARKHDDGSYGDIYELGADVRKYLVRNYVDEVDDVNAFVDSIADQKAIEGYVILLSTGQRVKIKTDWYAKLHHIKDSINSERRLYEAVVYDTIDDVRAQFWDDPQAIERIDDMVEKVSTIYNHMVDTVERFYERNKGLERKEYAILGQKELNKLHFGLAMAKYSGKAVDYRATMVKNRKDFGIKDDPETDAIEKEDG